MEINFDYKVLSEDLNLVKIESEGNVSPYYRVLPADVNGFRDGKGDFYRTYYEASEVSVTAQQQIGRHSFKQWDQVSLSGVGGRSLLTTSATAQILTEGHKHLVAVYESMDSVWITSPAAVQDFSGGQLLQIRWDQTMYHDMKVELFTDGFYVLSIADSVMENSFNWTVPDFTPPDYGNGIFRIKVSSRLNENLYDFSDDLTYLGMYAPRLHGGSEPLIHIHPNPATDVLWISLDSAGGPLELGWSIYTVNGKMLRNGRLTYEHSDEAKSISLDRLGKGTYILVMETGSLRTSKKLIIE
jgi:hypothetical protein